MATGYEDIDRLVSQQNSLLGEQEKKQSQLINQQTQMQVDELNREKEKLDRETNKTTQGLYASWQKQANQYGAEAEQLAQRGLANSGYAETTQTSLFNSYQKNVTETLNNSRDLKSDYDFKIAQARQSGSVQQAQAALDLYSQKIQLLTQNYELRQNREQYLYQKQYQQERDRVSDQQWQKTFDQQVRQNEIENQWKQKSFDYQRQRDTVSDSQWQKSFDYQRQRDAVSDNQWQQQFNLSKKASSRSSSSSRSTRSSKKGSSGKSSSGGLKVSNTSNSDTKVSKLSDNLIQKDGQAATFNIANATTDSQLYNWGRQFGVDLREYGVNLNV